MSEEHQAKREGSVNLIRVEKDGVAVNDNLSRVIVPLESVQYRASSGQ